MITRAEKQSVIDGLKVDLGKAEALFLTNLIGVKSNDAVAIRKAVRDVGGKIVITRNTLFQKAAEGLFCEKMLTDLKGTNALAIAFEDPAAVAKALKEAGKENELVNLKSGYLGEKELTGPQVNELANLPSRDQMLGTVLATFMAPVSALARVLYAINEQKEEAAS